MIAVLLRGILRQVRIDDKLFKVAEVRLNGLNFAVNLLHFLLERHHFIVVTFKERINTRHQIIINQLGQVEHEYLNVLALVNIEQIMQQHLQRLVRSKLLCKSQRRHKVEVGLDHQIVLAQLNLLVEFYLICFAQT